MTVSYFKHSSEEEEGRLFKGIFREIGFTYLNDKTNLESINK